MTFLQCIEPACRAKFATTSIIYTCEVCNGLLDLVHEVKAFEPEQLKKLWDERLASKIPADQSGVWRFRELLPEISEEKIVTMLEGNTQIFDAPRSAEFAGMKRLAFKHLGMNPTGSFKDLGMTTGVTQAAKLGAKSVACASTGNTSASMAAYAARAGIKAIIFIPSGQIALGKLSQALDYGATIYSFIGFERTRDKFNRESMLLRILKVYGKIWSMTYADVQTQFHSIPEFREWGRMMLINSNAVLQDRVFGMIQLTAEQRYAQLIETQPEIFQHVPLKMIASYLGVTDTSLSRIRQAFRSK